MKEQGQEKFLNFVEQLKGKPIVLLDKETKMTFENIQEITSGIESVVCDAYIDEMETGERESVGFRRENILLIDHHLPISEMSSPKICSTTLAIDYVHEKGIIEKGTSVIINHTDCDSVLSSSIIRGILPLLEKFGLAAIATDHTGQPNQIGDLLQSLEKERNIEFSLINLELLLNGQEIEPEAKKLLERRLQDRERAKEIIEKTFKLTPSGKIAYAQLDQKIDSGLFPALMPNIAVFLTHSPLFKDGIRMQTMEAKVRLGMAASEGVDLREVMKFDEIWGGRWNAGANSRRGGTLMGIEEYAQKLEESYQKLISNL